MDKPVADEPDLDRAGEDVSEMIDRVLAYFGADAEVTFSVADDGIDVEVDSDDAALLIGKHGQTIDALQHLSYKLASRRAPGVRVNVDINGYRERRSAVLERQAERAVNSAIASGRSVALEPMGANDRRIVHEYLKDFEGIETHSEGSEPNRCLVVSPI